MARTSRCRSRRRSTCAVGVEAEDAAVGREPIARESRRRSCWCWRRRATGNCRSSLANLRTIGAAVAALDVDLAVHEHRRRGIPARAIHVGRARQRVAARVEDVAVVVAGVRCGGPGPVVTARDEDVTALRHDDLRAAKDVRQRQVVERRVAAGQARAGIPHVVNEEAGLCAVGLRAVGQHASFRRHDGVNGDQRPAADRRPNAVDVRLRGNMLHGDRASGQRAEQAKVAGTGS